MKKIKNRIKIVVLLLPMFVLVLGASRVFAADTGTVSATVTPQNISVSVADAAIAYGVLTLSSVEDTTSGGVNDSQTATNDGNVTEDFNIKGANTTGGTAWTLAATIGADQYKHSFCTTGGGAPDPCDSGPTFTALTTSYVSLATAVSTSGTQLFDLKIDAPSSSTDFVEKTATVTVQAVQN